MNFDFRLTNDSVFIQELDLCAIFLKNDASYPWVVLIPKREGIREIYELSTEDQLLLIQEVSFVSRVMQVYFKPDKLNVASLGNIVSQLHIHIVARYKGDKTWPHAIWQPNQTPLVYSEEKLKELTNALKQRITKILPN